ncbi:hypothetical protein [Mycobacteroides saopaulense]|nr:hypothetical protein [Mycobacteroides saopaulense]
MMTQQLTTAMFISAALFVAGCVGPGLTDEGTDEVSLMKIEIPKSATNEVGSVNPYKVRFLMPNDEWRDYLAKYALKPELSKLKYTTEYEVPPDCIPAFRTKGNLEHWTAGGNIKWRKTDRDAYRFVSVIPDCEPGRAMLLWQLDPK